MRILIVNYRYFVSSGPERYLFSLKPLLEQRGHKVIPFSVRYRQNEPSEYAEHFADPIAGDDEILLEQHTWTPGSAARTLERSFYSRHVHRRLLCLIEETKPDVALVLQYLRKMSPSVLVALHEAGVPTVARLSDYGMICPGLQLMRDGVPCEECLGRSVWPSVAHRCVRGSLAASLVNACSTQFHRSRGYFDFIDEWVTPSAILREKLIEAGYDPGHVHHVPTFVMPCDAPSTDPRSRTIVYAGRFDAMKGIDVLIRAFAEVVGRPGMSDVRLHLFGDDTCEYGRKMRALAEELGVMASITFAGFADRERMAQVLATSSLSVVASITYENMPNALLESWACGTPVVVSDIGSLRAIVGGTGAGEFFPPGDDGALADVLADLLDDPDVLARMAEASIQAAAAYSPQTHVDRLLGVFEAARASR